MDKQIKSKFKKEYGYEPQYCFSCGGVCRRCDADCGLFEVQTQAAGAAEKAVCTAQDA